MPQMHEKSTSKSNRRPPHHLLYTSELALMCRAVLRLKRLAPKVNTQEHEPEGATMGSIREKKSQTSSKNREDDTKRERTGDDGKRKTERATSVMQAAFRTHDDRTGKLTEVRS